MQQETTGSGHSELTSGVNVSKSFFTRVVIFAFLGGGLVAFISLFALVTSKRIDSKSDEILAHFSERLDAKAALASTQLTNIYRQQAEGITSNSAILQEGTVLLSNLATQVQQAIWSDLKLEHVARETNSARLIDLFLQQKQQLAANSTMFFYASNSLLRFASQVQAQVRDDLNRAQASRESDFRVLSNRLNDLLESGALFPDKSKPAREAAALAVAAQTARNTNLAKIYLLSAINHAPSEFAFLSDYADLVLRDPSATTEDLARLKSVLQISMYQIPPQSITKAVELLGKAMRREEQVLAAQAVKPVLTNWRDEFERLKTATSLEESWADVKKLSHRFEALREIANALGEEAGDPGLLTQVEGELELTQKVSSGAQLAAAVDAILNTSENSSGQPEKAVSLLQAAESTLCQLWGIDSTRWPIGLRTKVDSYPKRIEQQVDTVAQITSKPKVEEVKGFARDAKVYSNQNWSPVSSFKNTQHQRMIEMCISYYEKAASAAQGISSTEGRKEAEQALKEIKKLITDAQQRQNDSYQKWALERCNSAFTNYNNTTVVSQKNAKEYFEKANLATVDQGLLKVAPNRVFNDVLGKLLAEIDGESAYELQKKCADTENKVKLEDF